MRLIDVLWLAKNEDLVEAAFEVEHTTSIHSGIVRLLDLAYGLEQPVGCLFIVAPDAREHEVREQLQRPAFRRVRSSAFAICRTGSLTGIAAKWLVLAWVCSQYSLLRACSHDASAIYPRPAHPRRP